MFSLEPIPDVKPEWERTYRIRALAKNDTAPVLKELEEQKSKHLNEYRKIIRLIQNLVKYDRGKQYLETHIKQSKSHPDVYELRPRKGQIRLFFFYHPTSHDIVVCTNIFWKAGDNLQKQNQAFEKCHRLRTAYLAWLTQTETPGRE